MSGIDLNKDGETKPVQADINGEQLVIREKKTEKKSKKLPVGFILAFIMILILAVISAVFFAVFDYFDKQEDDTRTSIIVTPEGEVEISSKSYEDFFDAIGDDDAKSMDELLDEYPALIYVQEVPYPALDAVTLKNSVETMRVMIDHGAKIDDRFLYESRNFAPYKYMYSLENYFNRIRGDVFGNVVNDMVRIMLDNGAITEYGYSDDEWAMRNSASIMHLNEITGYHQPNVLFDAAMWVCEDGSLTQTDVELLKMIKETGIKNDVKNHSGETAAEYFAANVESNDVPTDSSAEYDEIMKLLTE